MNISNEHVPEMKKSRGRGKGSGGRGQDNKDLGGAFLVPVRRWAVALAPKMGGAIATKVFKLQARLSMKHSLWVAEPSIGFANIRKVVGVPRQPSVSDPTTSFEIHTFVI